MRLLEVKYGDVFRVELTPGIGIIQCVKEAPNTGFEILRVLPGTYDEDSLGEMERIMMQKESFFLQLPLKYALKRKLLERVGNYPVPEQSGAPRYFRTEHRIGTKFVAWHIIDSETLKIRSVKELSISEMQFSEWDVISLPDLVEKIETGWTPEVWMTPDSDR